MDDPTLFQFEADFVDSLRCIPMAVRFKLDACAIKLSLRQWSRLTLEERRRLRVAPCGGGIEVATYRDELMRLVDERTGGPTKPLPGPPDEAWRDAANVSPAVADFARRAGLTGLDAAAWGALTPLQRFALVKLCRDNHDNVNFVPAMHEFGLA